MTTLGKRLDKLEAANDSGAPLYIFKWADESAEQAIARFVEKGGTYNPTRAVFFEWGRCADEQSHAPS
jgi:hypothetical protein